MVALVWYACIRQDEWHCKSLVGCPTADLRWGWERRSGSAYKKSQSSGSAPYFVDILDVRARRSQTLMSLLSQCLKAAIAPTWSRVRRASLVRGWRFRSSDRASLSQAKMSLSSSSFSIPTASTRCARAMAEGCGSLNGLLSNWVSANRRLLFWKEPIVHL